LFDYHVTLATAKVPQHIIQSEELVAVSCEQTIQMTYWMFLQATQNRVKTFHQLHIFSPLCGYFL